MGMQINSTTIPLIHAHFVSTVTKYRTEFPEFVEIRTVLLENCFQDVAALQDETTQTLSAVDDVRKKKNEWGTFADSLIKELFYDLKVHHPERLPLYFRDKRPSLLKNHSARITALTHIQSLVEKSDRNELKGYADKIRKVLGAGLSIADGGSQSNATRQNRTSELKKAVATYKYHYQKEKKLLDVYFDGTSVDYKIFFLDMEPVRGAKKSAAPVKSGTKVVSEAPAK